MIWCETRKNQGTGHTSSTSTDPSFDCCLIKIFKKTKNKQQGKIWLADDPMLWTLHSMTLQKGQNSSKNDDQLAKASIQWSPDYVSSANCLESDSALGISSLLKVVALLYRWLYNEQLEWDKNEAACTQSCLQRYVKDGSTLFYHSLPSWILSLHWTWI